MKQVLFARNLALAVRNDGTLWAWGRDEEVTGSAAIRPVPQQVSEVQMVQSVAWGDGLNILHTDGTVTVWIDGEFHRIEQLPSLVQIDGDVQFYNLGVAEDGTLWTWGSAWPSAVYRDVNSMPYDRTLGPERFQGHQIDLSNIAQISAGGGVILAIDTDGTVLAWGVTNFGELGTGLVDGVLREPTPIIVKE